MEFKFNSLLVTGCCGFIGSNVLNHMFRRFPETTFVNVDRLDYCADIENIDRDIRESPRYFFYRCDINNHEMINHLLELHRIDAVIHFAAQTHVDNSFGNSLQFTRDNVLGTHTLLECCRKYGRVLRFVHISTDEVYGEVSRDHVGCDETSLLNPTNPYAATKASAEHLVRAYWHSFDFPMIITRGNNVYGPRQYPEKLIPRFLQLLMRGEKCTVHGSGRTIRNFIHVDDVSRAIEMILTRGAVGQVYNIGGRNEFSVLEIAEKLVKKLKGDAADFTKFLEFVEDRNFNDFRYAVDPTNLQALGWKEEIPFEEGLDQTVSWYLKKQKSGTSEV
ncbi:MAG: dTDP-glucose 4,6-dehydratase [Sulfobacillus sp.]